MRRMPHIARSRLPAENRTTQTSLSFLDVCTRTIGYRSAPHLLRERVRTVWIHETMFVYGRIVGRFPPSSAQWICDRRCIRSTLNLSFVNAPGDAAHG